MEPLAKKGKTPSYRAFSALSPIHSITYAAILAGLYVFLLNSDPGAVRIIMRWIGFFRLDEIFEIEIFTPAFVWYVYRTLVFVILGLSTISVLTRLLRYAFSVFVFLADRIIVIDSSFFSTTTHQVLFREIARVSTHTNLAYDLVRLGAVRIYTDQRTGPIRFGPIPRFSSFADTLAEAIGS